MRDGEAQHCPSGLHQLIVATPIRLERLATTVVLVSVDLDNQPDTLENDVGVTNAVVRRHPRIARSRARLRQVRAGDVTKIRFTSTTAVAGCRGALVTGNGLTGAGASCRVHAPVLTLL